ncbi:diguanylate cyclase [Burkholderiaceae bacterium UC74_6]
MRAPGVREAVLAAVLSTSLLAMSVAQAAASAPAGFDDLRQRIENAGGKDRSGNIELMRKALSGPLDAEQRTWVLDRLSSDQLKLRRWQGALEAAQQGLGISGGDVQQRLRFDTLKANAYLGLAQPAEALRISEELMPIVQPMLKAADANPGYRHALEALRLRAMTWLAMGKSPQAMELLTDVLRRYDQLGDAEGRAETLHVIAALRDINGDRIEALRAESRAIEIAEQGSVQGVLPRLHGFKSFLHGKVDEEAQFAQELSAARATAIAEGDEFTLAMTMFNATNLEARNGRWKEALRLVDEACPIFERVGDLNMSDLCQATRGIVLNRMGHPEGLDMARRADRELAKRPGQELTLVRLQKELAEELAYNGDFQGAYAAQLEYQRREAAAHLADNQKRIVEAEAAYQADRREQQIEALEHEHDQQIRFRWLWVLVGALGLAVATVAAVSRVYLKRAYRAMHEMALEDPLTGLHNRRYLSSRISEELAQARRQRLQGRPAQAGIAFVLIDLDHFKSINDEYGHAAGDAVLRQASALLRSLVRQSDTLVRWGGEEFLVFAKVSSCDEAGELAERICSRMAEHEFDIGGGRKLHRTCSIGFACHPGPAQGADAVGLAAWEGLVSLSDQCLYAAKASGRDVWVGVRQDESHITPVDIHSGIADGDYTLHHRADREVRWPQVA